VSAGQGRTASTARVTAEADPPGRVYVSLTRASEPEYVTVVSVPSFGDNGVQRLRSYMLEPEPLPEAEPEPEAGL